MTKKTCRFQSACSRAKRFDELGWCQSAQYKYWRQDHVRRPHFKRYFHDLDFCHSYRLFLNGRMRRTRIYFLTHRRWLLLLISCVGKITASKSSLAKFEKLDPEMEETDLTHAKLSDLETIFPVELLEWSFILIWIDHHSNSSISSGSPADLWPLQRRFIPSPPGFYSGSWLSSLIR